MVSGEAGPELSPSGTVLGTLNHSFLAAELLKLTFWQLGARCRASMVPRESSGREGVARKWGPAGSSLSRGWGAEQEAWLSPSWQRQGPWQISPWAEVKTNLLPQRYKVSPTCWKSDRGWFKTWHPVSITPDSTVIIIPIKSLIPVLMWCPYPLTGRTHVSTEVWLLCGRVIIRNMTAKAKSVEIGL